MDKLGIEPNLLIAQLVNFTIIMVLLNKLLYKPILDMLDKRKKKIEEGLAITESMKHEEEKLEVKKAKVLADAKKEALELIEDAKKHAKEEAKQIVDGARKEADEIIEKGKLQSADQKVIMEKEVRQDAVELATLMAKRLLASVLSNDAQHSLLKKHIHELENVA